MQVLTSVCGLETFTQSTSTQAHTRLTLVSQLQVARILNIVSLEAFARLSHSRPEWQQRSLSSEISFGPYRYMLARSTVVSHNCLSHSYCVHYPPSPHPNTGPIHIRQEIGNIFLAGTINDQRSELGSAINGFRRQDPLNGRANFSPCRESSSLSRFSKPCSILTVQTIIWCHMLGHFPHQ